MPVFGEAGAVEQFEAPCVGIRSRLPLYYTFDLSRAYVVSKALKERRIGPLDHESLAREGVKVVDLSSFHVVPGRVEQRVRRLFRPHAGNNATATTLNAAITLRI